MESRHFIKRTVRMMCCCVIALLCASIAGCSKNGNEEIENTEVIRYSLNKDIGAESFYPIAPSDIFETKSMVKKYASTDMFVDGEVASIEDDTDRSYLVMNTDGGTIRLAKIGANKDEILALASGDRIRAIFSYTGYSKEFDAPTGVLKYALKDDGEVFGASAPVEDAGDSPADIYSQAELSAADVIGVPVGENYLLSLTPSVHDVESGIGGNKIGTCVSFLALKSEAKGCSENDYIAFMPVVMKYQVRGYSWLTINFGDGTGIVFPGCNAYVASYGNIDETGAILKEITSIAYLDNALSITNLD